MISVALALCYAGFLALCLAMPKHGKLVLGRELPPLHRRLLQSLGWINLTLAFTACVAASGWSIGPVIWFGVLSGGGLGFVFFLPYAPRLAVALGLIGIVWALATLSSPVMP